MWEREYLSRYVHGYEMVGRGSTPGSRNYSLLYSVQTGSGAHSVPCPVDTGGYFLYIMQFVKTWMYFGAVCEQFVGFIYSQTPYFPVTIFDCSLSCDFCTNNHAIISDSRMKI
jgi:hypothetical protein